MTDIERWPKADASADERLQIEVARDDRAPPRTRARTLKAFGVAAIPAARGRAPQIGETAGGRSR
jgi:hypothetical protein